MALPDPPLPSCNAYTSYTQTQAGIFGIDLNKRRPEPPDEPERVPEATGVVTGCVFLMVTILLIPMTFSRYLVSGNSAADKSGTSLEDVPSAAVNKSRHFRFSPL